MVTVHIRGRVDSEGAIILKVPDALRDREIEGVLVLEVFDKAQRPVPEDQDERRAFFLATAGSITDETFERGPQGEYEIRDKL